MTYQAVVMFDIQSCFDVARSPDVNLLNRKRLIYYNRGVLTEPWESVCVAVTIPFCLESLELGEEAGLGLE